jgi:hypothetical protein
MEIRRVETELIKPPTAGEHTQNIEVDRRAEQQRRQFGPRKRKPEDETPHDDAREPHAGQTYYPDGHVQELEVPDAGHHVLDIRL